MSSNQAENASKFNRASAVQSREQLALTTQARALLVAKAREVSELELRTHLRATRAKAERCVGAERRYVDSIAQVLADVLSERTNKVTP